MNDPKVHRRAETTNRPSCPQCGQIFDCCRDGDCWCAAEPYRLPLPDTHAARCLCPACLRKRVAATAPQ